jgi:hypothetical protein
LKWASIGVYFTGEEDRGKMRCGWSMSLIVLGGVKRMKKIRIRFCKV